MADALAWLAIVFAVAGSLCAAQIVARRLLSARRRRRAAAAEDRLTPVALALLAGENGEHAVGTRADAATLTSLLARYGQHVRGPEVERIAEFFEAQGRVATQLRRLRNRRSWRRATAAFALGDMGSRRAVGPLLEALDDPDAAVRAAAARSLGRLGAVEAVAPLVDGYAGGALPRAIAGRALLALGPAAVPALRELLAAPDAEAREFAVELIGLLGDAADGARIADRLRDGSAEVRAKAARALGRLGAEEAAAGLAKALDDRIPFVRVAAAHALAEVGDAAAVMPLLRVARADEFDVARAAAGAAARLAPAAVRAAARDRAAGPHVCEAADVLNAMCT